jgi:zinc/manganese transport system permease protein
MLQDVFAFALLPLAAAIVFTGIHTWLGLQVLRRNIVFADLALAQMAALGATVGVVAGHGTQSAGGFGYAFLFSAIGATFLTASRTLARTMRQEALIGVLYVVATAATILIVDRSPQGAEHVKRMLIGSILSVTPEDLLKLALLYGAVGALHWFVRRPLLAVADDAENAPRRQMAATAFWDLVFYLSFGVVVTSSVSIAGVLLVFCFLIVPAMIGRLFSLRIGVGLFIGWCAGALASAVGIFGSFALDAPTGAATVVAFALALLLAGAVRYFVTAPPKQRSKNRRVGTVAGGYALFAVTGLSGLWVIAAPKADHPVVALIEVTTGLGPEHFLTTGERADYLDAVATGERHRRDVDRLYDMERRSRWQGEALSDDALRRIGSLQQTLTEMGRGERFVMNYLRTRARERERWYVGLPLAAFGLCGLGLMGWRWLPSGKRRFLPRTSRKRK